MTAEASAEVDDLVNRLAHELAQGQRALASAKQKLGTTSRSLEARTQELAEARAALTLLLATLECTTDGILAMGYFGRAMHYNTRFVEMWRIPAEKMVDLSDSALLEWQLAQVRDPARFLADAQVRKSQPDQEHASVVELTDGRVLQCRVVPQRVRGKRVGCVTCYTESA